MSGEAERILADICDSYGITLEELKGQERTRNIATARKEAYRKLRDTLDLTWVEIASILNRKSHSTVLRGVRRDPKTREYIIKANSFEIGVLTEVIMESNGAKRQALSEISRQLMEFSPRGISSTLSNG